MDIVLKKKSTLSLFLSLVVILAAVFSFSTNTKAIAEESPDLSHLENVDISATFDTTKDGIQEEIIYDDNGEVVGTLKIEEVDATTTNIDNDPIEITFYTIKFEGNEDDVISKMMYKLLVSNDGKQIKINDIYDDEIQLKSPFYTTKENLEITTETTPVDSEEPPAKAVYEADIYKTEGNAFITNVALESTISNSNTLSFELKFDVRP